MTRGRRLFRRRWADRPLSRSLRRFIAVLGRLKSGQLRAKLGDLLPIHVELCRAPRSARLSKARHGVREMFLAAGRLHSHSALPLRNEPRARWKVEGCTQEDCANDEPGRQLTAGAREAIAAVGVKGPSWAWFGLGLSRCSTRGSSCSTRRCAQSEGKAAIVARPKGTALERRAGPFKREEIDRTYPHERIVRTIAIRHGCRESGR